MGRAARHTRRYRCSVQHSARTGPHLSHALTGAIPSPNIWHNPAVYEVENRAFDTEGLVGDAMLGLHDWSGRLVLDVGCGSGFHLPWFSQRAARVIGVEPHLGLAQLARRRTRGLPTVEVLAGTAQAIPLPDSSVDVVHARWSYFFGPGCEPGLAEVARVLRRGGSAFLIDNDLESGEFAPWFQRCYPHVINPVRFFVEQGFTRHRVLTSWRCANRADFEAIVRIEFDAATASALLAQHRGTELSYGVNLWHRRFD